MKKVTPHHDHRVRVLLIVAGSLSLVLAVIGAFLPVMPTTPFLLLSAFCYANSSERLHDWLFSNKLFGGYLKNWHEHRCIPLKSKILAIVLLLVSFGTSIYFFVSILAVKIIMTVIAIGIIVFLLSIRSCNKKWK